MIKKLFSLLITVIVLISFCSPLCSATNTNIFELWGDFENEKYHDAITRGKVYFHGSDATASIANIGANGSSHSLKIDTSNSTSGVFWIWRPAVPGETYDLSFKVKTDTSDIKSIKLYNVYDEKTYIYDNSVNINTTYEWVEYKSTFTVPTEHNGKKIYEGTKFQIEANKGVFYIDNLKMIPHGNVKNADHGQANGGIVSFEEGDGVNVTKPSSAPSGEAINIYVDSASGDDANAGTQIAPLASIEAARDLAKVYAPSMKNNIYIKIRGEQYIEETFTLDETNSGQNGYKIIYTSWGDDKATLTMAKKFRGFTLHDSTKNIWKINVGKNTYSRTAYFNDVLGIRARTVGYLKNVEYIYQSHYLCDNTELLQLTYPEEVEMVYHSRWYNVVYRAKSFTSENGRVRIDMNDYFYSDYNRIDYYDNTKNLKRQTPSYLENAYDFLDRSGEWYLDKHTGYLYYIPRQGEDMANLELKLPVGEEMIKVVGSSNMTPVSHISFDNLIIDGTTWLRVEELGGAEFLQNNVLMDTVSEKTPGFPDKTAVYFEACRYIDIKNCDFRHLGSAGPAVLFYRASKYINIIGNEFYELGGGALEFDYPTNSTPYNRSAASLCEYITVENNYFHDISLDFMGCAALSFGHPRHTKVRYNEICNTMYSGIHSGWGWEKLANTGTTMYDFEISYNYIHDIMIDRLNDGAHIYNVGPSSLECDQTPESPNNGANKNRIINNYLVNGWNCSYVYPDMGSSSWYVANNVSDTGYVDEIEYNFDEGQIPYDRYYWMHLHSDTIRWITTENNYAQQDYAYEMNQMNQKESSIEHTKFINDGIFPADAQNIIASAGIQAEYRDNFELTGAKTLATSDRWMSLILETPIDSELMILGDNNTKYNLTDYEIHWWIDDPEAVTIDENGMLTAHKEGIFEAEAFVFVNGLWQSKHYLLECSIAPVVEVIPNKLSSLHGYQMPFENGASTSIYKDYRWTNATTTAQTNNKETIQIVPDPTNSSNTVMKLTLASTLNGGSSSIRLNTTTSEYLLTAATGTIPPGGKITYTFRYYLDQDMEKSCTYNGTEYTPGFCIANPIDGTTKFAVSQKPLETKSKTWHKATLTYTNDTSYNQTISSAALRCAGDNLDGRDKYKTWTVKGHPGYIESTDTYDYGERTIYFDDLTATITGPVSTLNDYKMDFENGSSLQMNISGTNCNATEIEQTNGKETMQLVANPTNSDNTVLKVTLPSETAGSASTLRFSNVAGPQSASAGLAYGTIPAGGKITYSFRYYLPQEMNAVNVFNGVEYKPAFCIANIINGETTKFATSSEFNTDPNQWHTATLTYVNNSQAEVSVGPAILRYEGDNLHGKGNYTNWTVKGHKGYDANGAHDFGERIIYFDDFSVKIEELPKVIGISLRRGSGGVVVATDKDLNNANLIFATYDLNGKMIDSYITNVTMEAQNTAVFAPDSLKPGAVTKAMLWYNLTDCSPAAELIQY